MSLPSGTRLGPYEIRRLIGKGGMGQVYEARDTRLGRTVAIKVLPPELAVEPSRRRRFEQEARAVSALDHPHICTLHDVGEHDGCMFLVMEHLAGQTLAERLRDGPLSLGQALAIATDIADALAAAHRQGIVHRDLKPANIMLTKGGAKLLDFGLAKLRPGVDEPGAASALTTQAPLTGDHQVLGTLPYMAPEQLEGKAVDARSDVFALGCVIYEMLTGRRAFEGTSSASVIAAILTTDPAPVSTLQPLTPALLDRLVRTCLAKDPDLRWQNAHDVAEQLRAISDASAPPPVVAPRRARWTRSRTMLAGAAAVLVIVAAIVGSLLWARRVPAPPPTGAAEVKSGQPALDPNRVVVALFENRTGDPAVETVARMATDALTNGLMQGGLTVSLNPALAAGGGPVAKAAAELTSPEDLRALTVLTEAGLVVSGTIYGEGESLRFESRLIDAVTGHPIAPFEPIRGPRAAPSEAVAALAQRVAAGVAGHLGREVRLGVTHVPPLAAYQAYQAGNEAWGSDWDEAIRQAERALALDPSWASMRLTIFNAYASRNMFQQAANQLAIVEGEADKLSPFERAYLRSARAWLKGRWGEALDARMEQDRLAPGLWSVRFDIGSNAQSANRPRLAVETLGGLSTPTPTMNAWAKLLLCDAHHQLGEYAEELEVARAARSTFRNTVAFHGREARALAALGRPAEAERAVDDSLGVQRVSSAPVNTEFSALDLIDPGQLMCVVSMELDVHGYPQEALAMARRAVGWFETRPASETKTVSHRWLLAAAKYLSRDWGGARALYEPMADLAKPLRPPDWSEEMAFALAVRFRGRLGVIAARRGDRGQAEGIAKELEQVERPYLFGEPLYQRAAIATQLGDKVKAMELLREAVARGFGNTLDYYGYPECLHRAPELAPLRGYAPFEELIKPKG